MARRRIRRSSGGQPGNQNARKHGFYSRFRTPEDLEYVPKAAKMTGLDQDIIVLRVKIRSILAHDPTNIRVLCFAFRRLESLLKTREKLRNGIRTKGVRYTSETMQQFIDRLSEENDVALQNLA